MPFFAFAWIALISFGLFNIVGKLTSKYSISNPWLFSFAWTLTTLIFTLPIALTNKAGMPQEWTTIVIASFFNALWFIFFTFANYKLDVSVLSPLYNFRTVFAIILSAIILDERVNSNQFIYFIAIIIGGVFSSLDERFSFKSFFNKSITIGILGMLFLALNNIFVKKMFQYNGFWEGNIWMLIVTQIFLLATFPLFKKDLFKITIKQIKPIIAMAILTVIGNICLNVAYKENVGITSLILAVPASMIIAFLFSVFAPKLLEKHTLKVYAIRFTAATIMIAAALKLSN